MRIYSLKGEKFVYITDEARSVKPISESNAKIYKKNYKGKVWIKIEIEVGRVYGVERRILKKQLVQIVESSLVL